MFDREFDNLKGPLLSPRGGMNLILKFYTKFTAKLVTYGHSEDLSRNSKTFRVSVEMSGVSKNNKGLATRLWKPQPKVDR